MNNNNNPRRRSSTADYPIRPERIIEEQTRPICHFAPNELVKIVDDSGVDTGQSARFIGLEIDMFGYTGKANVAIVGGSNLMISLKYIANVKH